MKKGLYILRASIVGAAALALPLAAAAETQTRIQDILNTIKAFMDFGVPIILLLALLYFFYGLAEYILSAKDVESRIEGRERMIQGVVALFVMASVWGLVRVVNNTFGVQQEVAPDILKVVPDVRIQTVPGR